MNDAPLLTDDEVLALRPPKNAVDARRPYAFFVEPERTHAGRVVDVATIFLTNRECPFCCVMCDLWRNTTDARVPAGAIPRQIDFALAHLPPARQVKLYNSGNFFDAQAIPPQDLPAIADRLRCFERVIVENHPRLCTERCVHFRDLLGTRLEIALGLETVHPRALAGLNKRMSVADFDRAAEFLSVRDIDVRAFVLLNPPGLSGTAGVEWALRSIEHAFDQGAGCCAVIPARGGNGAMELLQQRGVFVPPTLPALEEVLEQGLRLRRGRVFADLWDIERLCTCRQCGPRRRERLHRMNLTQEVWPAVCCACGSGG